MIVVGLAGLAAPLTYSQTDIFQPDVLERTIPELAKQTYKNKDEEIAALKKLNATLRDEIIERNDVIYLLRATEKHATEAADECTGGKYSQQFRY